jgi:glycosyltransferase involved in cell wall biosynthesis
MPVVLWGHGYSKNPARWRDVLRNRLGRRAGAVLLYSRTIADRLIHVHGFRADRVFAAPNTLDQRPIQQAMLHWLDHRGELEAFQRRHRLDPQRTIIFVSRLLAENRIDMLLDTMVLLRDSHPDIKLILVGSGTDRPNLETAAKQVGLADRVIFTGAVYDPNHLAPWMLSSAVFCYPINIGLSIFTAFGFGLPVLTSDDIPSHNPEIEALRVDANGLTYRHGNLEDLARQLARILDDPPLRQRLSVEAHATATEQYTLEKMVQGFLDTTRLVDGKSRRVVSG